jgi:hypothetical protein
MGLEANTRKHITENTPETSKTPKKQPSVLNEYRQSIKDAHKEAKSSSNNDITHSPNSPAVKRLTF